MLSAASFCRNFLSEGDRVIRRILCFFALALLSAQTAFAARGTPGGQIRFGKWVGYLTVEGSVDSLALTMDSYQFREEGVTEFPRLLMLFKIGFGGYSTAEYEAETFRDIQYDFSNGVLTLDEPDNEMIINAVVYSNPTALEGSVQFRSTGLTGRLFLQYRDDEPGSGDIEPPPPLAPTLAGQYEGLCGTEKAVLQLETGRGLSADLPPITAGLSDYYVTGVLGIANGLCSQVNAPSRPAYCVDHAFSSGTYDFVQGRLALSGVLETNECTRNGLELTCKTKIFPSTPGATDLVEATCQLRRVAPRPAPFVLAERLYSVSTTAEQRKPLPDPSAPLNKDLIAAANGSFLGFLHHEGLDRYQPLRLNVAATNSTPNPHNENDVFASVSSFLYFGRHLSTEFWGQQMDRRALFLAPGFVLTSEQSDSFIQISGWKKGYIYGIWYSKAFGRVGTFQVVKGSSLPSIDQDAKMVESVRGGFHGPLERGPNGKDYWDANLIVPRQPRGAGKSFIIFQGNARLTAGGVSWPSQRIPQGAYDIYSGAVSWMADDGANSESRLVSGQIDGTAGLGLFWPNERAWSVGVFDRELGTYVRVAR